MLRILSGQDSGASHISGSEWVWNIQQTLQSHEFPRWLPATAIVLSMPPVPYHYMAGLKHCDDTSDWNIVTLAHFHLVLLSCSAFCLHWIRDIIHLTLLPQSGAHLSLTSGDKYTRWRMRNTVCEWEEIQLLSLTIVACKVYEWREERPRPISVDLVKRADNAISVSKHSAM